MPAEKKYEKKVHTCPFCDEAIAEASFPYCQACQVNVLTCPECKQPVPQGKKTCPGCGANLKKSAPKSK